MKVIAIASVGGHWVQLLRLRPAFEGSELIFVSTKPDFAKMVEGSKFYAVADASRWDKMKLIKSFFDVFSIIRKEKPDVVITTGAAPGLMGLISARILGKRTIWVDSIANVEELSMSGKIASKFASRTYTQWPQLATDKVLFAGNILS
ncbi:glycosyltransferase [Dyadobacter sp. 676]|uniref:Glycosyltransferase n=1 Tax=Dyadobacter sp. 676 TaxID=3088362 RepID=A0AAU8FQ23_9BACT